MNRAMRKSWRRQLACVAWRGEAVLGTRIALHGRRWGAHCGKVRTESGLLDGGPNQAGPPWKGLPLEAWSGSITFRLEDYFFFCHLCTLDPFRQDFLVLNGHMSLHYLHLIALLSLPGLCLYNPPQLRVSAVLPFSVIRKLLPFFSAFFFFFLSFTTKLHKLPL